MARLPVESSAVQAGPLDAASALAAMPNAIPGSAVLETDSDGELVDEWVQVDE